MDTLFTYNNLDFLDYNTESSTFCCHLFNHSCRFTRLSLVVEKQNTDETYFVTDLLGYLSFTTSVGCALSILRWGKLDVFHHKKSGGNLDYFCAIFGWVFLLFIHIAT